MWNRTSGKNALALLLIAAVTAVVTVTAFGLTWRQKPQPEGAGGAADKDWRALVETLRRDGLRGAARLKKHYVLNFDVHPHWLSFDLEKLTQNSEAVIVGVPLKNRFRLTADGQLIMTEYDVVVRETLKGSPQPGETVKVALVGGKVMFEDGTTAEVLTPDFEKMVNGKTYTLYLSLYPVRSPVYDLTAGPQGMFELLEDNSGVVSQARNEDPVKKQVKGKDTETFLKEARELALKWPEPKKCCS